MKRYQLPPRRPAWLTPQEWSIVTMRYRTHMSATEIARNLGISRQTVHRTIRRVREQVKERGGFNGA